jgi:glc operon protein GlcG
MHMKKVIAAAAALLLVPVVAGAQAPMPLYGPSIGHDAAMKAIAASEAEAKKNGWLMVTAVVDTDGRLVALSRMDSAQFGSLDIAIGKAVTANNFKRPTKAFQESIAQGGANLRFVAVPGLLPIEGGIPIVADGKIIGAIGVSGAASNQDAQCAMAGAEAAIGK